MQASPAGPSSGCFEVEASAPGPATVSFFLPEPDLDRLATLDPDESWRELQVGERAWLLQTFLRLARAGHPVRLTARPQGGIVVYHAKQWRHLERLGRRLGDAVLLAVRGDVRPAANADFDLVQNPALADGRRHLFVPHWPQPGLVPRDPARGTAVRRAAYKGFRHDLCPCLREPGWKTALQARGIDWLADEVDFRAPEALRGRVAWPDYREVDAVVALRPPDRHLHPGKPATKLVNAWLAGVPAVLGPEQSYRFERRGELDYIEAADAREALAALVLLQSDPGRYRAMVANGHGRATAVGTEAVLDRWLELLFDIVPSRCGEAWYTQRRQTPRSWRLAAGRLQRIVASR